MKAAVIVFPGSNCDRDVAVSLEQAMGKAPLMIWHRDTELPDLDLIVVPGGFSYGDYLRSGAMGAHSPIMTEVKKRADAGAAVLGICNGFQILTETGLLPGALMRNRDLKFLCKDVELSVERTDTLFTANYAAGQSIRIPIAHHDGNYFAGRGNFGRIGRRRPRRLSLCGQSQRFPARHRRYYFQKRTGAGHDAAPGAPGRPALGGHGR